MKRFISVLLLVLALVSTCLLASGCAAKEPTIVGTWNATVDFSPVLLESLGSDAEDYLELDSFDLPLICCFNEDNTCKLSVDEDAFRETKEKTVAALTNAMVKYIEVMLEESGNSLSLEDYEKDIGMTIEDYVSTNFSKSFDSNMITTTGEYSFNGTELTMGEDEVFTVKLDENTLTFIGCSEPDSEVYALLKDVVWERN